MFCPSADDPWADYDTMVFHAVANSRLAMLGVVAALLAESSTGRNVFEQIQAAPGPIAGIFFLFTLATAIPVFKGVHGGVTVYSPVTWS